MPGEQQQRLVARSPVGCDERDAGEPERPARVSATVSDRWTGRRPRRTPRDRADHRGRARGCGPATTRLPSPSPRRAPRTRRSGSTAGRTGRCGSPTAASTAGAAAIHPSTPSTIADDRRDRADDDAVGQHHQPQVPFGRADRGQQAELALPALCHDDEPGGGDQADERHEQRRRRRARAPPPGRRSPRPMTRSWLGLAGGCVRRRTAVPSTRRTAASPSRPPRSAGRDQRELVGQVARVLDPPTTVRAHAAELDPISRCRRPSSAGHGAGERDLTSRGLGIAARGAAPASRDRSAPSRILRAHVEALRRAGHRDRRVRDHVDRDRSAARRRDPGSPLVAGSVASSTHAALARRRTRVPRRRHVRRDSSPPRRPPRPPPSRAARARSSCWRHSRRNSRHAQRTTRRRAGLAGPRSSR